MEVSDRKFYVLSREGGEEGSEEDVVTDTKDEIIEEMSRMLDEGAQPENLQVSEVDLEPKSWSVRPVISGQAFTQNAG